MVWLNVKPKPPVTVPVAPGSAEATGDVTLGALIVNERLFAELLLASLPVTARLPAVPWEMVKLQFVELPVKVPLASVEQLASEVTMLLARDNVIALLAA